MSAVEFASFALRERIAPPSIGSMKSRRVHAARVLRRKESRVHDAWYRAPRMRIDADEIKQIEAASGLVYQAKREAHDLDATIARAEALLDGMDEDFHRPFVDALRAFTRAFHRT